jgi:group II intron reverse transcriptase/maturase
MNDRRESDSSVVPTKPPNKSRAPAAEVVEGRELAKGKASQQNASWTQSQTSAPSALERIRQAARKDRKAKFTALLHHVTVERLGAAFYELKKKAAPGIDGVTWEQYEGGLEENIRDLHRRLQQGAYRAKPSRRVYIPKADGRERPLGVASLEDKLVQRAVVEVLNAIYEVDFLGFSYGFRPGRGPHDALDALAKAIMSKKVNWVLDADIRGYFDTINHEWLMKFIEHRIADKRVLRLIRKWLNAGVMEEGRWTASEEGTPQGATVSPLLANIYLHYVLDLWVQQWRRQNAGGDMVITRWADDFIVGFEHPVNAERFLRELRERFRQFSLELHPEKTRLIEFGRYAAERRGRRGEGKPATFNFLGFTHICGKTREGKFQLERRTIRQRMRAKLKSVKTELRRRWHLSIREQGKWLGSVMRGFFAYHAVPTNYRALRAFRVEVEKHWLRALRRRGQRDRTRWKRLRQLSRRWLPVERIQHPWPDARFDVRTQGGSRVR